MNRKQAYINQAQESEIYRQINGLYRACKDPALSKMLRELADTTRTLPSSDSKKLEAIDFNIGNYISELAKAVHGNSPKTASHLIESIREKLTERAIVCFSSSPLPLTKRDRKMYERAEKRHRKLEKRQQRELKRNHGSVEEFKLKVVELQDENEKLRAECFAIFERLRVAYDPMLDTEMKLKNAQIKSNFNQIIAYTNAIKRQAVTATMDTEGKIFQETARFAPITDADLVARASVHASKTEEQIGHANVLDSVLAGKTPAAATEAAGIAASAAQPAAPAYEAPAAPAYAAPATPAAPVYEAPAAGDNPYANAQNPFAETDGRTGTIDIGKYFEDVDEHIAALKGSIGMTERALASKKKELGQKAAELKELLLKRKEASAAECKALDGDIDIRQSDYATAKRSIDRLDQERAGYALELAIVMQIRDIRDEEERRNLIDELSNRKFTNVQELALAINEVTKRKNALLEEMLEAAAVASGTDITNRTFAEVGNAYESSEKDENKYAGLEKELGLRD